MSQEPTERYDQELHPEMLGQYVWCAIGDVPNVHCSGGIVKVAVVKVMMWEGLYGYRR